MKAAAGHFMNTIANNKFQLDKKNCEMPKHKYLPNDDTLTALNCINKTRLNFNFVTIQQFIYITNSNTLHCIILLFFG